MKELTVQAINNYARKVQEFGFGTPEAAPYYSSLVELLFKTAKDKADYFYTTSCYNYRIDKDQLLSLALFEGVKYTIGKWDENKCDYFKRYAYYLPRLFQSHMRNEVDAEVRSSMSSAIGLDTPVGEDITLADTLVDNHVEEDVAQLYRITAAILRDFGKQFGADKAAVMGILLINADNLDARTKAVVEYYGADTYSNTIRKRVERIRKAFQEFYTDNIENYA